ncbi:MAG: OadG family protein [Holophagales bacterium]|jgi:sodium pump decarboxylase gamma subunit|nr:OadG family protein [Holophagales bacterium]
MSQMSQLEAWIVTVLGMSVVFIGLILCIMFINVFNRAARHIKWEGGHEHDRAPAPKTAAFSGPETAAATKQPVGPLTPEVIAVIAAAIEIDQRLYQSSGHQRLTIRRAPPAPR